MDDEILNQLKNSVSSGKINFLFGAGVNGCAFPNLSKFEKTKGKLRIINENFNGDIESELSKITDENQSEDILNTFITEFNGFSINTESESYTNLKNLLDKIDNLVDCTENRQPNFKKINIFTLNYDNIVETILEELGLFHYTISANYGGVKRIADLIGYDFSNKEFIPSFLISKLHGSVNSSGKICNTDIILPQKEKKIKDALMSKFFKVLFKMKSELNELNSVLFILGYSGSDQHVNSIVEEASKSGLKIYWLKYNDDDCGVGNLPFENVTVINSNGVDSTKVLLDYLGRF